MRPDRLWILEVIRNMLKTITEIHIWISYETLLFHCQV